MNRWRRWGWEGRRPQAAVSRCWALSTTAKSSCRRGRSCRKAAARLRAARVSPAVLGPPGRSRTTSASAPYSCTAAKSSSLNARSIRRGIVTTTTSLLRRDVGRFAENLPEHARHHPRGIAPAQEIVPQAPGRPLGGPPAEGRQPPPGPCPRALPGGAGLEGSERGLDQRRGHPAGPQLGTEAAGTVAPRRAALDPPAGERATDPAARGGPGGAA